MVVISAAKIDRKVMGPQLRDTKPQRNSIDFIAADFSRSYRLLFILPKQE